VFCCECDLNARHENLKSPRGLKLVCKSCKQSGRGYAVLMCTGIICKFKSLNAAISGESFELHWGPSSVWVVMMHWLLIVVGGHTIVMPIVVGHIVGDRIHVIGDVRPVCGG
jgi:hypothetical protein